MKHLISKIFLLVKNFSLILVLRCVLNEASHVSYFSNKYSKSVLFQSKVLNGFNHMTRSPHLFHAHLYT